MNHVNLKKPSLYIIINSRNNSRQLFLLRKISENVQLRALLSLKIFLKKSTFPTFDSFFL